jgi:Transposase DDE domain
MALHTCFLPNFPRHLQGKAKPSGASLVSKGLDRLRNQALPDLSALLGKFFADDFFVKATAHEVEVAKANAKPGSKPKAKRQSIYTPTALFWSFLFQVLNPGMACQGVVDKVRAWLIDRPSSPKRPSLHTGAYCLARLALSLDFFKSAFEALRAKLTQQAPDAWLWCGRSVKVLDGTSVSMPDTADNQLRWPQPTGQKKGCGFPVAKMLGVFCLSTGAWLGHALGKCCAHDLSLWHRVCYLGDAGFCAWALMAENKARGVDTVFRLHQSRSKDMRKGKALGRNDRLQTWIKPKAHSPKSPWTVAMWLLLPAQIEVRVIKVPIERKGFRTQCLWVATTLTDAVLYPLEQIAELYYRRWSIELFFRDIKTTLRMEVLRCKTPQMVEKEIYMHATAYNAIRLLILHSAIEHQCELGRISFKGALDLICQWLPKAASYADKPRRLAQWNDELLEAIAEVKNQARPGRREPRAKKRRPKNHQLLTKPRHEFQEIPHREQYVKAA